MRIARLSLAAALLGVGLAATAYGQEDTATPVLRQPISAQQAAYEFDRFIAFGGAAASPGDQPPVPGKSGTAATNGQGKQAETAPMEAALSEEAKPEEQEPENKCRWCQNGKLADPWKLPEPHCVKNAGFDIGGWVQSGILSNAYGAPSNGPLGFNTLPDFNLHQLWMYAERKPDTTKNCFDWGARIDYIYGVDGPDTQAFGDQTWDYGWNSSSSYGSAIPQFYVELAYCDWSIKGGRFFTPIGYEVIPATGNFFFSHSYQIYYAEPFTHTGFIVTRKISEKLSAFGGWVDGWDSGFANDNAESTFLGGITATLNKKVTLGWALTAGDWGNGKVSTDGDIYMNTICLTYKPNDKWTYVLHHDLGSNTNNPNGDASWYGIGQYVIRKINDCWSAGGRLEWFDDPQGVRVVPGNEGSYYEATLGLNYKPHANVVLRPEVRWDWFAGDAAPGNLPFNNGQSNNQFAGGFDMIVTF
jgi:hypothetical protein